MQVNSVCCSTVSTSLKLANAPIAKRSFRNVLTNNAGRTRHSSLRNTLKWTGCPKFSIGNLPIRGNGGRLLHRSEAAASDAGSADMDHVLSPGTNLVSSSFDDDDDDDGDGDFVSPGGVGSISSHSGSALWIIGPVALISSLLLPQFVLSIVADVLNINDTFAEIFVTITSEVVFYIGLSVLLLVTERVQRPYIEIAQKQWGLITDHSSYLYSSYFTMGIKVFAPLAAAYVVWPAIGLQAVAAVSPFLLGLAAQYGFEMYHSSQNSSCWPLLRIIFEIYRLYQLNRGTYFIGRLRFLMETPELAMAVEMKDRSQALVSMLTIFQILGIFCLWSLISFLLRLFPLKPVATAAIIITPEEEENSRI